MKNRWEVSGQTHTHKGQEMSNSFKSLEFFRPQSHQPMNTRELSVSRDAGNNLPSTDCYMHVDVNFVGKTDL